MAGLSLGDIKISPGPLFVLLALAIAGLSFEFYLRDPAPKAARDFEECIDAPRADAAMASQVLGSGEGSPIDCNARFAGRRKPGGGYSYYDFMQDRVFDIAGPNPTAEERNWIDREYLGFLDSQRRENISAELAKRQDEQLRADLEAVRQPAGRPMILTPKITSSQLPKGVSDRGKPTRCEDHPLVCGWSKFSADIKNAFASSSRNKP